MLTAKVADFHTHVSLRRTHNVALACAYGGGAAPDDETISLDVTGPLPAATARATYDAAYREARNGDGDVSRLRGFGPRSAFGVESSKDGRAIANVYFLDGRWIGTIAVSAPDSMGDATIDEMASMLKRSIWPRWTGRRR